MVEVVHIVDPTRICPPLVPQTGPAGGQIPAPRPTRLALLDDSPGPGSPASRRIMAEAERFSCCAVSFHRRHSARFTRSTMVLSQRVAFRRLARSTVPPSCRAKCSESANETTAGCRPTARIELLVAVARRELRHLGEHKANLAWKRNHRYRPRGDAVVDCRRRVPTWKIVPPGRPAPATDRFAGPRMTPSFCRYVARRRIELLLVDGNHQAAVIATPAAPRGCMRSTPRWCLPAQG